MLVAGCWLLVAGCWWLVAGGWPSTRLVFTMLYLAYWHKSPSPQFIYPPRVSACVSTRMQSASCSFDQLADSESRRDQQISFTLKTTRLMLATFSYEHHQVSPFTCWRMFAYTQLVFDIEMLILRLGQYRMKHETGQHDTTRGVTFSGRLLRCGPNCRQNSGTTAKPRLNFTCNLDRNSELTSDGAKDRVQSTFRIGSRYLRNLGLSNASSSDSARLGITNFHST
ncbi:unnamed protein product [Protopolystoma xenopodis]|uniref:Uncharacterized protein n=1 Tax=Protopolystoma xenopodis TaxID=117903 RepID=A0A448XAZ1_9PLAT|nr:unnamed protein product [Protopolystoma xenopodis]